MPSVRDIAKQAGVSITTVSRVLNNHPDVSPKARDMVLTVANRSRYVSNIGRRSMNNIAFIYNGDRALASYFDAGLLQGIGDALEDSEFDLMILDTRRARRSDETFSQMLIRKGVRGAILRAVPDTRAVWNAIAAEGFPVVVVGTRFEGPKIPCIYSESRSASREAIDYLIGLGHQRIAISINIAEEAEHADRLAGYQDSLNTHGIEPDERLVWKILANGEGGTQIIKRVLSMADRPTAVYITDPLICAGALAEARRQGVRIPEDLSIIGFDDGDLRIRVYPQLSTVCQDSTALGRSAYKMLEGMLKGELGLDAEPAILSCWFELHDTTAIPSELPAKVPAARFHKKVEIIETGAE